MTKKTKSWIEAELEDTLDEMFEEEFNAPVLTEEIRQIYRNKHPNMLDKTTYYRNLLRLQVELIKLQDWVKETGSKLVIICEGRDVMRITYASVQVRNNFQNCEICKAVTCTNS